MFFICLGKPVAHGIIGIMIVITCRVVGFLQAIEGIVHVIDGDRT